MRVRRATLIAVTVGAGLAVVPAGPPAGAAVNATTAGTVLTVSMTGNGSAEFDCSGSGTVRVNFVEATPALSCAAMTQVTIAGDAGSQAVYVSSLNGPDYAANPRLVATLGDGSDFTNETDRADQIDMGAGDDMVLLRPAGPNNAFVSLGAGASDNLYFEGTPSADAITATSSSGNLTLSISGSEATTTRSASGVEFLRLGGAGGNDTISTTGITLASTVDSAYLSGDAGNDTLTDGPIDSTIYGDAGNNILTGGPGFDAFWTSSDGDTLNGGTDTNIDRIYDAEGLRSGGRSLSGFTEIDVFNSQTHQGDVTVRIRPGLAGTRLHTTSLTRPGQQIIPASIGTIAVGMDYVGSLPHKGLVDVVATERPVTATLPAAPLGLLDVTIPTGTWTTSAAGGTVAVTSSFGRVSATNVTDYRVHGPWTQPNRGFVHRATRDLLFRFATDSTLNEGQTALDAGTRTRAQITAILIGSDEYRGLDVDRTFLKYLRRAPDPGGRTYWINSIRNGKALWRFRAQLFGSNEYFTKAGGTNAFYVAKAYADVLGRAPDPSGQAFWTNKLNNGADRGSVALQFINSPEARRRLVDDQFLRFLDRLPTATEQTTWVAALPGAAGEQALIQALVSGSTYYNRS